MIRYVIKNYIKLMCRSSMNVILLTVTPIILIAVLSSAFSSLMDSYDEAEDFRAGYMVSEQNVLTPFIDTFTEEAEQNGVSFIEFTSGEPEELIRANDLAGFVEFTGDSYVITTSSDHEIEGKTLSYMMNSFEKNIETGVMAMQSGSLVPEPELTVVEHDYMPAIDSVDYYGIIEVVYFLWCGIVCIAGIVNNEKKFKIMQKLRVAGLSETQIYFSKFIPTVAVVSLGIGISWIMSVLLFGVHWGNIPLSVLIIFLMITASVSMGLLFYSITNNVVATIMITFAVVWFAGFVGGSFETYLFSSHPQFIKDLSPVYYGNRALVELSCMGKSDYAAKSILLSVVMTVTASILAIGAGKLRKRGNAC
ncbi:MAG: ABC transporter permease [Clostridiales bacterium]|nr:ABC transporter permease [Clostridiales bacterium]